MMSIKPQKSLSILCLACSSKRLAVLQYLLRNSRYSVLTASTSEEAVALCVAQVIAAAIVDAESIRGQEWTVLKSLKSVRCNLPIILLSHRESQRETIEGVDAVVSMSSPGELYKTIDKLVGRSESMGA